MWPTATLAFVDMKVHASINQKEIAYVWLSFVVCKEKTFGLYDN